MRKQTVLAGLVLLVASTVGCCGPCGSYWHGGGLWSGPWGDAYRGSYGPTNGATTCGHCGGGGCGYCGWYPGKWLFRGLGNCGIGGCGPLYWSEFHNDPPNTCNTCDNHGNWIGTPQGIPTPIPESRTAPEIVPAEPSNRGSGNKKASRNSWHRATSFEGPRLLSPNSTGCRQCKTF